MVLESTGRFTTDIQGKSRIYVKSDLVKDSQFPLKSDDTVKIKIDGKKLIIEKIRY